MKDLPKIKVNDRGYLVIEFPNGQQLPEVDLIIRNQFSDDIEGKPTTCEVTVTFTAEHCLKNL